MGWGPYRVSYGVGALRGVLWVSYGVVNLWVSLRGVLRGGDPMGCPMGWRPYGVSYGVVAL